MQKRWVIKDDLNQEVLSALSEQLDISSSLAGLLVQRDINSFNEAKAFFRPNIDQMHDPFLMKDMDKAVNRLTEAIGNEENILVYGDYDVDGTTSVATFFGFLSQFYDKLEYYIPDRYKEGYGVSEEGIKYAAENGYTLIVTLDCGIKAVDKIALAKKSGIDVIICDHHTPGEKLPEAFAILDPKREDCDYPYKELSGCGVGFKLLHGFSVQSGVDLNILFDYLDLLAVSIASDIVPLTGENRVMAHFGLKKLNSSPRPGLQALLDLCRGNKHMTISSIVFGIGPRINAAGRMDHAGSAVELLLAKNQEDAKLLADTVNTKNDARRDFDSSITEEAIEMITTNDDLSTAKSTVLYKENWHKGVIGIVASRCIEKFYRPTVILTESNEKVTGSARSVDGFNVYEAISECSELLDQFGGHMYAAGVTMPVDNVDAFRIKFEEVVSKKITKDQLTPSIYVDSILDLEEIDRKFYNIISQMAPFGPKNMQPLFVTKNIQASNVKLLKEQHLKFTAKQAGTNIAIEAIGFGLGDYYDLVNCGLEFGMAFTIEENDFRGQNTLQLFVKDIKFED